MAQLTRGIQELEQDFDEGLDNLQKENYVWDDFSFPVSNLRINPATTKPDYNYNEGEYLFDASSTETVVGKQITKHQFKAGVPGLEWRPHIHWMQSQAGNVIWELQYKISSIGEAEPSYTTIQSTGVVITYTSGIIHQISTFPAVDVSNIDTTACVVTVKVSRLGANASDTYTIDARFQAFDFHVPIDQIGSRQEFIK